MEVGFWSNANLPSSKINLGAAILYSPLVLAEGCLNLIALLVQKVCRDFSSVSQYVGDLGQCLFTTTGSVQALGRETGPIRRTRLSNVVVPARNWMAPAGLDQKSSRVSVAGEEGHVNMTPNRVVVGGPAKIHPPTPVKCIV